MVQASTIFTEPQRFMAKDLLNSGQISTFAFEMTALFELMDELASL